VRSSCSTSSTRAAPFSSSPSGSGCWGLPDPCAPAAQTLQERRNRVVQKFTLAPGPQLAFYLQLAEMLGYTDITIDETGYLEWTVNVPEARVTYFRCGASRCSESLGKIDRAEDLECLLRETKPAHTTLVFNYEGVE
jgi:uncharacterized protein YmfQ (DUF2313 family)